MEIKISTRYQCILIKIFVQVISTFFTLYQLITNYNTLHLYSPLWWHFSHLWLITLQCMALQIILQQLYKLRCSNAFCLCLLYYLIKSKKISRLHHRCNGREYFFTKPTFLVFTYTTQLHILLYYTYIFHKFMKTLCL